MIRAAAKNHGDVAVVVDGATTRQSWPISMPMMAP